MEIRSGDARAIAGEILGAVNSGEALARAAELLCAATGASGVELTMHADDRIAVVRHGEMTQSPQLVRSEFGAVRLLAVFCSPPQDYSHLTDVVALALHARFANQSASIDALTGVHNRSALERKLSGAVSGAIAILDVDNFKSYNDTYGHMAGDAVLRRVAHAASASLQSAGDFFARFGGEEFVAVLDCKALSHAITAAEHMRDAVRALNIPHSGGKGGRVTVSVGVAMPSPGERTADVLARADAELYRAKVAGRNRVCANGYASTSSAGEASHAPFLPVFGRERELLEVHALLKPGASVTLTGPAGIGKSRLAFQIACEAAARFERVGFIDVWSIMDGADLSRSAQEFTGSGSLVVLDGCEHVVDSAQNVIEALLQAGAAVLVTSRTSLGHPGEMVSRLGPVDEAAAIALLRAAGESAGALVDENDRALANLLRRSCGVPSELIAAGLRLAESSDAPPPRRQRQSLQAIAAEAILRQSASAAHLCAAAAFAGPFTIAAAAFAAQSNERQAREHLDALHAAGLLARDRDRDRYVLAGPLARAVAHEPELRDFRRRAEEAHLQWCLRVFEDFEQQYGRVENQAFIDRIQAHIRDVELALRRALADPDLTNDGFTLCSYAARYWFAMGKCAEIERWINAFLDTGRGDNARGAWLFLALARVAYDAERWNDLQVYGEMTLRLAGNDERARGAAYNYLGISAKQQGDAAAARDLFSKSLAAAQTAGNIRGQAVAIASLGSVAMDLEVDLEAARAHFQDAVRVFREIGDQVNAVTIETNLIEIMVNSGEFDAAHELSGKLVEEARVLGNPLNRLFSLAARGSACYALRDTTGLRNVLSELLELPAQNPELSLHRTFEVAGQTFELLGRYDDAATMFLASEWFQIHAGIDVLPVERYHHKRALANLGIDAQKQEAIFVALRAQPFEHWLNVAARAVSEVPLETPAAAVPK